MFRKMQAVLSGHEGPKSVILPGLATLTHADIFFMPGIFASVWNITSCFKNALRCAGMQWQTPLLLRFAKNPVSSWLRPDGPKMKLYLHHLDKVKNKNTSITSQRQKMNSVFLFFLLVKCKERVPKKTKIKQKKEKKNMHFAKGNCHIRLVYKYTLELLKILQP